VAIVLKAHLKKRFLVGRMFEKMAKTAVKRIKHEIRELMKGCEYETLFHLVAVLPKIFAELSKERAMAERIYVKPSWFRSMIATSVTLNELLPEYLPLKPPTMFRLGSFKNPLTG